MKIVICDDDQNYIDEIKQILQAYSYEHSLCFEIRTYTNPSELLESTESFDLAFLDVEMPKYSGIQVGKKLKERNRHTVIFIITSHDKYLDDAMDLNVFRYIPKPIDPIRVLSGLEKALKSIDNNVITFYLKSGDTSKNVTINDIIYIETIGHSTKVVTTNGDFISENKMDFWNKKLIASFFAKVHKSYIVNMNFITEYQRDNLVLNKEYNVPIAYRKQAEFRKIFFSFVGGV